MKKYIDSIQDPLDKDSNLQKYVTAFSQSNQKDFQNILLSKSPISSQHLDLLKSNRDSYYQFLFQNWMIFITSISNEQFQQLKKENVIDDDFLLLKEKLLTLSKDISIEEISSLFHDSHSSFSNLARKYGFPPKTQNKWRKISSHYFLDNQKKNDYFLSIHSKSYDLFKICRLFHKECLKECIPCQYQFHTSSNQIDNIIIWSDEKNLSHYLDIIRHLKEKYPNLFSRCEETSPVTSTIIPNVGLGVSNIQSIEDYYSSRCNHIYKSIQTILWNYVINHYQEEILPHKSLIDLFAEQIVLDYIKEVNLAFLDPSKKYQDFYQKYHFFIRVIHKKEFYQIMVSKIRRELIKQFRMNHQSHSLQDIQLSYQFGWDKSKHIFSKELIRQAIQKHANTIFQFDSSLYDQLRSYLKVTANSSGVSDEYHTHLYFQERSGFQKRK